MFFARIGFGTVGIYSVPAPSCICYVMYSSYGLGCCREEGGRGAMSILPRVRI